MADETLKQIARKMATKAIAQQPHNSVVTLIYNAWFILDVLNELDATRELLSAAKDALKEMCNATAPRNSFTDAVDRLDAAIAEAEKTRNI
jgi:hypothetical protein